MNLNVNFIGQNAFFIAKGSYVTEKNHVHLRRNKVASHSTYIGMYEKLHLAFSSIDSWFATKEKESSAIHSFTQYFFSHNWRS